MGEEALKLVADAMKDIGHCLMCGWPPACKDIRCVMARTRSPAVMCPAC